MRPVRSGQHRRRVELIDEVKTGDDSFGQPITAPEVLATFWAEVRPLRGAEVLNVKQIWATASLFVSFRWLGSAVRPNPTHALRLLPEGRILNILSVSNVEERNRSYELICGERVAPP